MRLRASAVQELQTAEVARLTLLAALLLPLRSCQVQDRKGKQHPVTAEVVGEGMKWPKKMASNTAALHAEAPGLLQTYKALQVRLQLTTPTMAQQLACKPAR